MIGATGFPGSPGSPRPPGPDTLGPDAISPAAISRLGRELHSLCAAATQPEEIAAALEAHGLNDDLARERYGMPDVFACAEALFVSLPLRSAAQAVRAPSPSPAWDLMPRGLLYALPGAALAVAAPLLTPHPGTQTALFAMVIFGWGWGQGLASIGYRKTGEPLRHFLRRATLLSLPVAALVGGVSAALTHQPVLLAALVGGVAGVSFAAFAALLMLRHLLLAACVYLPSVAVLLFPSPSVVGNLLALACAALLPLLALADRAPLVAGLQLPNPRWTVPLAHALSGWGCALFVTTVFGVSTWNLLGPGALLPVILSIGVMETLFLAFSSRLRLLAARHTHLAPLAFNALGVLLVSLTLYLLVLALFLGVYAAVTPMFGVPAVAAVDRHAALLMAAALLAFGGSLLLGTVVSNLGRPGLAVAAWVLGTLIFLLVPAGPLAAPLLAVLGVTVLLVLGVLDALLRPITYQ